MKSNIFNVLLDAGDLSEENIKSLEKYMSKWKVSSYQSILMTNLLSEHRLADRLAGILKVQRIYNVESQDFGAQAFGYLSYREAKDLEVLPLGLSESKDFFTVVLVDPTDLEKLNLIRDRVPYEINLAVGERRLVHRSLDDYFPAELQIPSLSKYGQGSSQGA